MTIKSSETMTSESGGLTDRFVTLPAPSPPLVEEATLGELRGGAREVVICSIVHLGVDGLTMLRMGDKR